MDRILTAALDFAVITSRDGLLEIESDWNELWAASHDGYLTYSFQATRALIENPLRQPTEKFWCLTGRSHGRLVLAWPFIIYRHSLWRMASSIADTIDYSDPLLDESLNKPDAILQAMRMILRTCPCDLVQFQFMRSSSALHPLVEAFKEHVSTYTTDIPLVVFDNGWASYERSLSKSQRHGLARKRRNLLKLDAVEFKEVSHTEIRRVLHWLLPRKNDWLHQVHKTDETHMSNPNMIRFVTEIFVRLGPWGRCKIFAIVRRDEIIAVDLCFINNTNVQWYFGTFNSAYEKYSPGMLLKEHVIRWAFDRGLNYDMLRGFGRHKSHFLNVTDHATTYRLPRSVFGHGYIHLRRLLKSFRLIH